MKLTAVSAICLLAAMLLCLTACGGGEPAPEAPATTQATTPTTVAIIEEKLEDMLTVEEISAAVGVPMGKPAVSGQGTVLTSIGTETMTVLSVEVSEKPKDIFMAVLQGYPDLQPCPNLGETAWFSPVYNQLLVYGNGFMITIELTGTNDSDQNVQMLRCRQIAALLLEHL